MSRRRGYISFFDRVGRRRGDTLFYAGTRRGPLLPTLAVIGLIAGVVTVWWLLTRPDERLASQEVTVPEGVTVPSLLTPVETTTTIPEAVLSSMACPSPLTTEWNTFQGNAGRTGCVEAPTITQPRILWTFEVGIQGWLNNPVIGNGRVFVGSAGRAQFEADDGDAVYAIDLATGREAWVFEDPTLDVNGVSFADDVVVATGDEGNVWAIDASQTDFGGRLLWEATRDTSVFGSPLIMGDRVIVGDADGMVAAYSMEDGTPLWEAQVEGAIRGGPSSDGEIIVVAGEQREILALDRDGTELWRKTLRGRDITASTEIFAAPTISDGVVILSLVRDDVYADPALMALDLATGVDLWIGTDTGSVKDDWGDLAWGNLRASPATVGDLVVSAETYSQGAVVLGADDGETRGAVTSGPFCIPHWPSPAVVSNQVILPRHDGGIYAVDLASGNVVWSLFLGDSQARGTFPPEYTEDESFCEWGPEGTASILSSPAISQDGIVVVGTLEGVLYAIADT
ncbi:MAG: PQQ-binding-like beta-propeller repeat protein [Acidimicrobiia bacterium]|nr:PQQ-binding-like beta-propeller repeat protein [Acidimicrobiia bacterium]